MTECLDVIRLFGLFKLIISLWSADIYVQTCKFLITPLLGGRLLPDLETSRIGPPFIYDISSLRVNHTGVGRSSTGSYCVVF